MILNPSGIEPADVKVLVLPDPVEEKTSGGILLPDALREKEKYATIKGKLVAKGPNAFVEWGVLNDVPLGARIITAQYAGMRAKGRDDAEYILCNDEDVIATLKEDHA